MSAPRMDIVIHADGADSSAYRNPRAIARLMAANGYPVRTIVVIDKRTGLTSTCEWDR